MRWRLVWAVARKDLLAITRSRAVMVPLIMVPLILNVALPIGMSVLAQMDSFQAELGHDLQKMLTQLPGVVGDELRGLPPAQQFVTLLLGYAFGPLFLVVPLMVSSLLAADSFAGEHERGTLEALLYTPTTDLELFAGKCAGAWLVSLAVTLVSFVLYCVGGDVAAWPVMQRLFLPNVTWLLLALWVAPPAAGLGLAATVVISSRAKTLQDAMQLSGLLVLPVVVMMIGQLSGVLWLSPWLLAALGAVLWVAFVVVGRLGARAFQRSEILSRLR